jgi:hypothetical protein
MEGELQYKKIGVVAQRFLQIVTPSLNEVNAKRLIVKTGFNISNARHK